MGVKRSGINSIDALLKGSYWGRVGKPVTLTYSIRQTGSQALDDDETDMVNEAINQWKSVAKIEFKPVSKGGNLRFSGESGTGGLASYKYERKWWNPFSWGSDKLNHVNIKLGKQSENGIGGSFLEVALHEIGHALGLKHPGNYNGDKKGKSPFLSYSQDNNTNTVMSYNDVGGRAATPMPYDIRAVQYLYGARSFNSGNTTYKFSSVNSYRVGLHTKERGQSNKPMKLAVWDSAGVDTFDLSKLGYSRNGYHIDINQGGIITYQDEYNQRTYKAQDNSKDRKDWETHKTSPLGTTIAYGARIENVVGSSSDDKIIGNSSANVLRGGRGDDDIKGNYNKDTLYGDAGNDTLDGGSGSDRLYGGSGNDYLNGGSVNRFSFISSNDYLDGGSGNDYLDGGSGSDRLYGGSGNDHLYGDSNFFLFSGFPGNDYLDGGSGNDFLYGGQFNDTLVGSYGNDYLNGGTGSDSMSGGSGNDRYVVDNVGDRVVESFNQGVDQVDSSLTYTLGVNVENLRLTGRSSISGYGNALNNSIRGNNLANYIRGNAGDDRLYGYGGNDTLTGDWDNDYLNGGTGSDRMYGGSGNDYLNGGTGSDRMYGGSGNDHYVVDNVGDRVVESFNQGLDQVSSSINYTLGDHLENLSLTGKASRGYGNALNNSIRGNNLANYIRGSAGDDYLYGYDGNDTLTGDGDNDYLNGGTGSDRMYGGSGNDRYVVDNVGDLVVESFNQGVDQVSSSINYTLGANLENLRLTGSYSISGYGNELNNDILGNSANNVLVGNQGNDQLNGNSGDDILYGDSTRNGVNGNDTLIGGKGDDILVGGLGADNFLFGSVNEGMDWIVDFAQNQGDTIQVSASGFGSGLILGELQANQFTLGAAALRASDRFVYDQTNGSLFFDSDGTGDSSQIQIARLSNIPTLNYTDFSVVV